MHCFKRWLSALFALTIVGWCMPSAARAATGDATILKSEILSGVSVKGLAQAGDALVLLMGRDTYCTWTREAGLSEARGFDALALAAGESVEAIFQGMDGPCALSITWDNDEYAGTKRAEAARVWRLSIEDGKVRFGENVSLGWPEEEAGSDSLAGQIYWPFVDTNSLVFSVGQTQNLMVFDLGTGAAREIEVSMAETDEYMTGLTGYGAGRALAVTYSLSADAVSFYEIDLKTGEAERVFTREKAGGVPGGLCYDEAADRLYYVYQGELLCVEGLNAKTLASVNTIQINAQGILASVLMGDGFYVCTDGMNAFLSNTNPDAQASATLNVCAFYNSYVKEAADAFMTQNPDVDVILTNDAPDVISAMMSRSDAVDIYTFDVNSSQFAALYERGFVSDLSGSDVLSAYVGEMYPVVQGAVTKDGALVAIPVNESLVASVAYSPKTLEKLGLTQADLPGTWMEFLRFLAEYPARYGDAGISAFSPDRDADDVREDILNRMIGDYVLYLESAQGALFFDTELFRTLVSEFEKVDFSALIAAEDEADRDGALFGVPGRLDCSSYQSGSGLYYYEWPLPLSVAEDAPLLIGWELTVAVVNPFSRNYDAAAGYLEAVTDEVWEYIVIDLCPDRDDPIENEGYAEEVARQAQEIEDMKTIIDQVAAGTKDLDPDYTADEEEHMLREALAQNEEELESYRENGRYEVSPEAIQAFRAYGDSFVVLTYPGLDLTDSEGKFQEQVQMYLDGLNDAEAFIGAIEDMARMMIQEGM